MRRIITAAALTFGLGWFAAPLAAQKAGDTAPEITWITTYLFGDIPAKKLSDLRGSVVLMEFWGTH